jgi:hypothetical protein
MAHPCSQIKRDGLGKGQKPHQDCLRHLQLLHDGPVGDLDLLELNRIHLGTSIRVFADQSRDEKNNWHKAVKLLSSFNNFGL